MSAISSSTVALRRKGDRDRPLGLEGGTLYFTSTSFVRTENSSLDWHRTGEYAGVSVLYVEPISAISSSAALLRRKGDLERCLGSLRGGVVGKVPELGVLAKVEHLFELGELEKVEANDSSEFRISSSSSLVFRRLRNGDLDRTLLAIDFMCVTTVVK